MKKLFVLLSLLLLLIPAHAQDISAGYTPVDGQRLTAAQLLQLVNQATIQPSFLTSKAFQGAPAPGDLFLVYSVSSGTFHKITATSLLYTNFNLISSQVAYSTTIPAATFLFYDPTNQWMGQITESNLAVLVSSGITASNLVFYNTNGLRLPLYNTSQTATNNPLYVLVFDTNGVPSALTLSNLFSAYSAYVYTNLTLPLVYQQMFAPWTIYGTNSNFTNAWGTTTNWPIFSLFTNNAASAPTNVPTLVDGDTIPIKSTQQGNTNTTVTLNGIYQYLTNKNALPPYTVARIQFGGLPASFTATNFDTTRGIATNVPAAANWTTPTAVSFIGALPPTTPQVVSNTLYYALLTNTTPIGFQIFTNLATALLRTNQIVGTSVPSIVGTMYWVTNYTSFNADVIQLASGSSIRTAEYDVYFQTNAVNNLYYVTPSCQWTATPHQLVAALSEDGIITTTHFRIATGAFNDGQENSPRVMVLVNPQ